MRPVRPRGAVPLAVWEVALAQEGPGSGLGAGPGNATAGGAGGGGSAPGTGGVGAGSGTGTSSGKGTGPAGTGSGAGTAAGSGAGGGGAQSPYSGAKPGSGVLQRGSGSGPAGSGGPRRGGPGGLGPGGSGGTGTGSGRGPNDTGSNVSGWSTKDEDILGILKLLTSLGHTVSGQGGGTQAGPLQEELTKLPAQSQEMLRKALAAVAAQAPAANAKDPMLLRLAEHLAIKFALDATSAAK